MPGLRKTFPGPYFQRTLTKIKYNFQVDYMCGRSLHPFPHTHRADFNFYRTYNRSASFSFYPLKIQGFWVEQLRSLGGPRRKSNTLTHQSRAAMAAASDAELSAGKAELAYRQCKHASTEARAERARKRSRRAWVCPYV